MIDVQSLRKNYSVHTRAAGLGAAVKSLFYRTQRTTQAVKGISFHIEKGERVGFLGPNGAGKTTTLKMLSGLLVPTSGQIRIAGYEPQRRQNEFLKSITLVAGQKQQLIWDLPPQDTFALNRAIYEVNDAHFERTLRELTALLKIEEIVRKPTRQLSLGERMKCELVAALIHQPRVLFLDEPTIGLDVQMQRVVRDFLREYNRVHNATILLTSHDMNDVEAICDRVILINHGEIIYDGLLSELKKRGHTHKRIQVTFHHTVQAQDFAHLGEVQIMGERHVQIEVAKEALSRVMSALLERFEIADLTVENPPLEAIFRSLLES